MKTGRLSIILTYGIARIREWLPLTFVKDVPKNIPAPLGNVRKFHK